MADKSTRMQALTKEISSLTKGLGGWLGKLFDRIVYSKTASLVVSGLFALIFCISISFQDLSYTFLRSDISTLNLSAVPIEVLMDTENYEVSNLPGTADLTVEGDAADIQLVRTQNSASIIADLRNLQEGDNVVVLKAAGLPSGVNVQVTPPSAEVDLQRKYTQSFPITADLLSGTARSASDFTAALSVKNVTIKATRTKLDEVRSVKAIIDASKKYSDFTVQAPLVAYDSGGKQMDVSIIPDTVEAQVSVKDSSGSDASKNSDS